MFYHDNNLQYPVRVDTPNPVFARMLQQAVGGVEGEIRVMLQYMFQSFGARGPAKYRDMLLETGTEEISHIQMLCTAVALNLEGAPTELQDEAAKNPMIAAVLGGMEPRQYLSAGFSALAADANGVPFDGSHVYASGNIAADMYANIAAEATGRVLATRLYSMTDDAGMKDMLAFLIARDTMHQQQWQAVLVELQEQGDVFPIPNSFPQNLENQDVNYVFMGTNIDPNAPIPQGRWSHGPSLDGKAQFTAGRALPMGQVPVLGPPRPEGFAQTQQMQNGAGGLLEKVKNALS